MVSTEEQTKSATKKVRKTRPRLVWLFVIAILALGIWKFSLDLTANPTSFDYADGVLSLIVLPVVFGSVAALILERRPGHLIGRLLMIFPFALIVPPLLDHFFLGGITQSASFSTAQYLYAWFSAYSWWFLIAPILFVIQLYPTGKLLSPKWRRAAYFVFFTIAFDFLLFSFAPTFQLSDGLTKVANPLAFIPENVLQIGQAFFGLFLLSSVAVSVASLAVRFRHSKDVERAQLKWLFYTVVIFLLFFALNLAISIVGKSVPIIDLFFGLSLMSIPLAIGIGILRYRLWDIDVVINRSLVYGALTTILAALFAAITSLAGLVAKNFAGGTASQVAAAVGAIIVAGLFQPLRTALEKAINKRLFAENVDISEGLGELNPELWQYIGLHEILSAALEHLQDIYKFDKAAIYVRGPKNDLTAKAACGVSVKAVSHYEITPNEQTHFLQKKGVTTPQDKDFVLSIPLYWPRRKGPQVIGVLRLGKRQEGRGYSSDEIKALQTFGGKLGQPVFVLGTKHGS